MESLKITGGSYLLELDLYAASEIQVGALGLISFPEGRYWYCGNARTNMAARLRRHCAIEKKLHWHIDYLRPHCDLRSIYCTVAADEQALALKLLSYPGMKCIPGFGSSDSPLPSHLIYSDTHGTTLPEQFCGKHQLQRISIGKTGEFSIQ